MKSKLLLGVATGAALIAITAVATAGATPHQYSSAIVIDGFDSHYFTPTRGGDAKREPDAYNFYGRIESAKGKCLPNRGVDLYFLQSGTTPDIKMGHTTSDSNGGWAQMTLPDHTYGGPYYARVLRTKLPNGSICKADRSPYFTNRSG